MSHFICLDCNAVHMCEDKSTHPVFTPSIAELPPTPGNVFTFPSQIVDQELPSE